MNPIKIGIFGFGTVGSGTVEILRKNSEIIEKNLGVNILIEKICVRTLNKKRSININTSIMTTRPDDIIENSEIDIVVEVMGGIKESKDIIERALKKGKHVVSANKDLIGLYGKELSDLAKKNNCHFYYEASVAGGIPIIKTLQNSLLGNNINKISGIINGSTNYILTRMEAEELAFKEIVEDAKELGFLESDPSADLDGFDAGRKCAILASIGFHSHIKSNQVYVSGIREISLRDIKNASKWGYKIKLLALAENKPNEIVVRVHPVLLPNDHPLASVKYELNAVLVNCDMLGETMYYGPGAGALPTGSAIVGDILTIAKKVINKEKPEYAYDFHFNKSVGEMDNLEFSYYLRLLVKEDYLKECDIDLLITNIFKENNVELYIYEENSFFEKENSKNEILIKTKKYKESLFKKVFKEISEKEFVEKANFIRIEE